MSFVDSRCPGMYLFEANAYNGISSSGMSDNITGKVIIEKSRGEVSLMGQDTIKNVS